MVWLRSILNDIFQNIEQICYRRIINNVVLENWFRQRNNYIIVVKHEKEIDSSVCHKHLVRKVSDVVASVFSDFTALDVQIFAKVRKRCGERSVCSVLIILLYVGICLVWTTAQYCVFMHFFLYDRFLTSNCGFTNTRPLAQDTRLYFSVCRPTCTTSSNYSVPSVKPVLSASHSCTPPSLVPFSSPLHSFYRYIYIVWNINRIFIIWNTIIIYNMFLGI